MLKKGNCLDTKLRPISWFQNCIELAREYNVSWRWDPYTSEGGYRPVGNVPYRVNDRRVEQILKRIETDNDRFRSSLDSALDASRFNGSREEDNINSFVKDFFEATKPLRDRFNDHKATGADVQNVLDRAARIHDSRRAALE
jgi:hypothetical protein